MLFFANNFVANLRLAHVMLFINHCKDVCIYIYHLVRSAIYLTYVIFDGSFDVSSRAVRALVTGCLQCQWQLIKVLQIVPGDWLGKPGHQ